MPIDTLQQLMRAFTFAAERHRQQARKDELKRPYVNHLIDVVQVLVDHGVRDIATLQAAALHDTVEDTDTTLDEIELVFGREVRDLVDELSDDKTLEREERRRLQVEHARDASPKAAMIFLADKSANAWDVGHRPASNWSVARRLDYLRWAAEVVERLPDVSPELREHFERVRGESVRRLGG